MSVLTGCNEPETPQTEVQLSTDTVDVPAEGGTMNVGYTVSNPAEGAYWSVPSESELEWISDFDFSEEGVIKFNVDTNDSATQREEEVVLEYSSIPGQTFSFLVRQQGKSDTEPFTVEMIQINYVDATARITPADPEMTYLTLAYTKESLDAFNSDDEIIDKVVSDLSFLAGMMGMTVEDFISKHYLLTGENEVYYDMLSADHPHYIYVVGLTEELVRSTYGVKHLFQTKAPDKIDIDFEIDIQVNGPDVIMTTTPSENNTLYYSDICLKSDYSDLQSIVNYEIWKGEVQDMTKEEVLNRIRNNGTLVLDTILTNTTEYIAFAASVNDDGLVNSDVKIVEFTTGEIAMSDIEFELEVVNIKNDQADLIIKPSNNDWYSFGCTPASEWEGKTDEEYLEEYVYNNYIACEIFSRQGQTTNTYQDLTPDTEYYLFAFGYRQSIITAPMKKIKFKTTKPASDPENLIIDIDIIEYDDGNVTTNITVNDEDCLYYIDMAYSNNSEDEIRMAIEEVVNRWVEGGYAGVTSPIDYFRIMGKRGSTEAKITGLFSGTEYKIFGVGISELDGSEGELASTMYYSDVFKTTGEPEQISPIKNNIILYHRNNTTPVAPINDTKNSFKRPEFIVEGAMTVSNITAMAPTFRLGKPITTR